MICVTEIKALEVPDDWHRLDNDPDRELWLCPVKDGAAPEPKSIKAVSEIVRGTRIITPDKREICIGMSKQAHELLGLPFEVIDNQKETIETYGQEIVSLKANHKLGLAVMKNIRAKLDKYIKMSFWERLGFLFKGTRV